MIIGWRELIDITTASAVIVLLDSLRSLRTEDKKQARTFTLLIIGYLITFQFMIDVLPNTYFPIFVIIDGSIVSLFFLIIAFYKHKIDVWIKPLLKNSKRTIFTVVFWGIGVLLAYFKLYLAWWIYVVSLMFIILLFFAAKTLRKLYNESPPSCSKHDQTDNQTNDDKKEGKES